MDKNIHAMNALSGLMQGPFDVGNVLVGRQGVMEMMVALCGSEREVDQLVAIEALIHASTKMSRASFIITNGVSLLKDIYKKTKNEKIKIRALVVKLLSAFNGLFFNPLSRFGLVSISDKSSAARFISCICKYWFKQVTGCVCYGEEPREEI